MYKYLDGLWSQIGQNIIDTIYDVGYNGWCVSLSDDGMIIAIGAPFYDSFNGRVQVYKYINNEWIQSGQDIISVNGDQNGYSIALSECTYMAFGARRYNMYVGCVRVYKFANET